MSYYLFLDDERFPQDVTWVKLPPHKWTIVRNYKDFVRTIEAKGLPKAVSFDHDLGHEHYNTIHYMTKPGQGVIDYSSFKEKTGYDAAKWMVDYCQEKKLALPKEIYVHSMNPIGARNILQYLESYENFFKKNA